MQATISCDAPVSCVLAGGAELSGRRAQPASHHAQWQRPPALRVHPVACTLAFKSSTGGSGSGGAATAPAPALPSVRPGKFEPVQWSELQTPHAAPAMRQMAAIEPVAPHPAQLGLAPGQERQVRPGLIEGAWAWNGQRCRYLRSGDAGPAVVCVHGFAAAADHWAHNLPYLGAHGCRAWALDLLGAPLA